MSNLEQVMKTQRVFGTLVMARRVSAAVCPGAVVGAMTLAILGRAARLEALDGGAVNAAAMMNRAGALRARREALCDELARVDHDIEKLDAARLSRLIGEETQETH